MLKIERNEIEHEGGTSELLTDAVMIIDFIYERLEAELGHRAATKLIKKLSGVVIKKKRKERRCNIQKR